MLIGLVLASYILLPPLPTPQHPPQPWMEGGPQDSRVIDHKGEHARSGPPGVVVKASFKRRLRVDCRGGPAAIDGNTDRIQLSNCSRVSIDGSHNGVTIAFLTPGGISVNGNGNVIHWTAPAGVPVTIGNVGRGNEIARADGMRDAANPVAVRKKRGSILPHWL
jgi:hypothetical protein